MVERKVVGQHGAPLNSARRILVMGVSGCGKSTIGEAVAERIGCAYIDGDHYHPQANIDKMSRGEPLNDDDRAGWLEKLSELFQTHRENDDTVIIGCSGLKRSYRDLLRKGDPELVILFLDGSYDLILERMQARHHFFSPQMLKSQFATLERPGSDEAERIDIDAECDVVVDACVAAVVHRDQQLSAHR
ncbi:gluconokinase [Phytohalomonas tamaricis]|uniref:gluconokinase n=1 Tax=Phytohalomonas tamaricis TaxID=2081032 RepID=UPI000D0BCA97|nr:gluconokinase [Phytohalomonas tamaricis]